MSGTSNLWTPIGGINFPITPTSIDGMAIGASAPAAATVTVLTAQDVIISGTGTITLTGTIAVGEIVVSNTAYLDGPVIAASNVSAPNITASTIVAVGNVTVGNLLLESVAYGIALAQTTNTFAGAVALTAALNVITAAAFTSGSPVSLPSVAVWTGGAITVFNQTTHTVAVWPQPADIIDVAASGADVLLDAGKRASYFAVTATQIISAQYGTTSV